MQRPLGWISQELERISHSAGQERVMLNFFFTGKDQLKEELPLEVSKVAAADGDRIPSDGIQESGTISGAGLWHSGRPDLIQWIPKQLTPG